MLFKKKRKEMNRRPMINLPTDIRMRCSNKEEALTFLRESVGKWIYIKYCYQSDNTIGSVYTKFKIRNIQEYEDIYIYGEEDEDRLVLSWNEIERIEITPLKDEIFIKISYMNIYIKKYQPLISILNELPILDKHIIVTEGKTDWKLLKAAFETLRLQGKYTNLDISFLEYEDELEMGEDKLRKVRDYNAIFQNAKLRIFIFDADIKEINQEHSGGEYRYWGNNVYSLVLPIPQFRKSTPLISIENYFSDDEIKTTDEQGRRLYLAGEFDKKTGRHNEDSKIITLVNKDAANQIIDNKVYIISDISIERKDVFKYEPKKNIALSKSNFAQNILDKKNKFGQIKFDNFELVFDIIEKIMHHYYDSKDLGVEVSEGVYIEQTENDFENMFVRVAIHNDSSHQLKKSGVIMQEILCSRDGLLLDLMIETEDRDFVNVAVSIKYSDKLICFLENKINNRYNRIYLQVFDENGKQIKSCELFSGEDANAILKKTLLRIANTEFKK